MAGRGQPRLVTELHADLVEFVDGRRPPMVCLMLSRSSLRRPAASCSGGPSQVAHLAHVTVILPVQRTLFLAARWARAKVVNVDGNVPTLPGVVVDPAVCARA